MDCIDDFLEESNIESHISSKFDFIIDAIDQSSVKTSLAEYCQSKNLSADNGGWRRGQSRSCENKNS